VGQCTWYCYGRIQEVGLITSSQLTSKGIFLGNASTWIADAVAAGYATGSTPQVGALAVWTGQNHVAFVESVSGSTITVTECNNTPKTGANIVVGGAYARLRSTKDASSAGNILWTMPEFTVMSALSGPSTVVNGYQWVQLTGNGYTGYVAWLDLVPSQPATPTGLQWNITQFQNSPGSPWITSASPTYIYLGSQPPVAIIFATSPAGLQVTVDGTTYTTPMTFNWVPSSQHTLSVPTPQYFGLYSRYVFNGTQNQTITTPSSSYTYTANLSIQYDLTMAAGTGGSCSPSGGWYDSGSVVAIGATPNGGYSFSSWTGSGTGSYTGTANSTSVTMNAPIFETANFTANPQTGSLQVTISPAGAVNAGAQWQVDGGTWQSSGATVSGLAVGSGHTLAFNTVSGWTTPGSQTPTIVANQTMTATGTYVAIPQTGSLQVTLSPAGAVSAGAQWQVDGGAWQSSGATVSGLAVGSGHTLAFKTVSGWTTPGNQTPTIIANQTTTATGTYVVAQPQQLTSTVLSNGVFHFTLNGPVGTNYVIEVSSNLVNWTILSTNVIPANGATNISDPSQGSRLRRFYRAVPFGTNIVFSDSFSGNIINSSKWTTSANTVLQSTNTMEVLTTATDAGGNLTSVAFPVNSTGKITITRQVFLHYGNSYFIGHFGINIGSLAQFSVQYADMTYGDGVTFQPCYGFYLTRNNARPDYIASAANIGPAFTPVWDTWFNEKVTYDPATGVMEYFINGVSKGTYNVGALPPTNSTI